MYIWLFNDPVPDSTTNAPDSMAVGIAGNTSWFCYWSDRNFKENRRQAKVFCVRNSFCDGSKCGMYGTFLAESWDMVGLRQYICDSIFCIYHNILLCTELAGQPGSDFEKFGVIILWNLSYSSFGDCPILSVRNSYTASVGVAVFSAVCFVTDNPYFKENAFEAVCLISIGPKVSKCKMSKLLYL